MHIGEKGWSEMSYRRKTCLVIPYTGNEEELKAIQHK